MLNIQIYAALWMGVHMDPNIWLLTTFTSWHISDIFSSLSSHADRTEVVQNLLNKSRSSRCTGFLDTACLGQPLSNIQMWNKKLLLFSPIIQFKLLYNCQPKNSRGGHVVSDAMPCGIGTQWLLLLQCLINSHLHYITLHLVALSYFQISWWSYNSFVFKII